MNDLKVSSRLGWSFGAAVLLLAVADAIGIWTLSRVNALLGTLVSNRLPKIEALHDMA